MFVHQLPPSPPGLRMRVWRRLQDLGALQLKGSVYLLPADDDAREDLQWLLAEVLAAGGDASLWRADLVEGLDAPTLAERFRAQSMREYDALATDARELQRVAKARSRGHVDADEARRRLARLRQRFDAIVRRDRYAAGGREIVGALLEACLPTHPEPAPRRSVARVATAAAYRGRTWVTRPRVRVDRMASAWLVRRFIDVDARFAFADDPTRVRGAVSYDSFGGEFSHEGEACTFEVLVRRFGLRLPGLDAIAQIVHDIDLKQEHPARAETAGIAISLDAIADAPLDDDARLAQSAILFDGLLARFARGG
jgi:hypothetical protein